MNKKVNVTYLLIYFICLIALCIMYFVYLYQPWTNQISELNKQHLTNTAQINEYNLKVQRQNQTKADIEKVKQQLANKKKFAPLSGRKLPADINDGLKNAGITPISIAVGEEIKSPGNEVSSEKIPMFLSIVTMSFSCNEKQLTDLLHYYEKSSTGVYYVTSLTYAPVPKTNNLAVSLVMTSYYFGSQYDAKSNYGMNK